LILDVRTQNEFDRGHIPNAVWLPYNSIVGGNEDKVIEMIGNKGQIVLVYCQSGRRSEVAARALVDMGYTNVFDFGGIVDWAGEIVREIEEKPAEWITVIGFDRDGWGMPISVDIPVTWEWYMYDTGDPDSYFSISGEVEMSIWWSTLGDIAFYRGLEEFANSWEHFQFDDGNIGYMIEYDESIIWYRSEWGFIGIGLRHEGDRTIFTNNEDLILRIVRSVRR